MKVKVVVRHLKDYGWVLVRRKGRLRQSKHPYRKELVTVPGKPGDELAPGTVSSIFKQAGWKKGTTVKYAVVTEKAPSNYSAYVPDLPGCVATGATVQEAEAEIQAAMQFHLEGPRREDPAIPIPSSSSHMLKWPHSKSFRADVPNGTRDSFVRPFFGFTKDVSSLSPVLRNSNVRRPGPSS